MYLLGLAGHAICHDGRDEWQPDCHSRCGLRVDRGVLGQLAHDYERGNRERQRNDQLQRRRQHGFRRTGGHGDSRHRDLHVESKRLLRLQCLPGDSDRREYRVHRLGNGDSRERLRMDRHELGKLADDYQHSQRQRQWHGEIQRRRERLVFLEIGHAYGWIGDPEHHAEWCLHLLAVAGGPNCCHIGDHWQHQLDHWRHLQRDSNELGQLVVDYERRVRQREPHDQLQRGREFGYRSPIRNRHGWFGNVRGDTEWIVHVCRHTYESEFCPLGGNWKRDGDNVGRLFVDRFAIGIVDHDHRRVLWKWDRVRHVSDNVLHRFVLSNGHADRRRPARDHHAIRCADTARPRRAPHRQRTLTTVADSRVRAEAPSATGQTRETALPKNPTTETVLQADGRSIDSGPCHDLRAAHCARSLKKSGATGIFFDAFWQNHRSGGEMGKVERIWTKRAHRGPMDLVERATLEAGRGLVGSANYGGRRHVTIISVERWAELSAVLGANIDPVVRRANLLVSGIDLTESRNRTLLVGGCRLQIGGETRPCERMEEAHAGLQEAMRPRWGGGAWATVEVGGEIKNGDPVSWEPAP